MEPSERKLFHSVRLRWARGKRQYQWAADVFNDKGVRNRNLRD